ncbi:hypothetical protein EJP82_17080 [Paenibacillus anaericanus]|uniref:Uncharacterized protein n=1 Tax=Paenibacillus anaericanus TaxID=170367 RepID=A0A3S1DSZ8_9BACL|nr:hypothetical protein EJP82_17080 [Paenibacillus anaericanus]
MIKEKEDEVSRNKEVIRLAEQGLHSKEIEQLNSALQTYIAVWRELFKDAYTPNRKMIFSTIIGCIRVYRDLVELELKIDINSF